MPPVDLDEHLSALMARFQAGDETAFDEMYRLSLPSVTGFLGRLASRDAADDLVQETFLRVIEARRTFRAGAPFRPWFFAIARHVALDARRRWWRRRAREVAVVVLPERPVAPPAENHLDGARLAELVCQLPEDQREVVWLARVEGMTSAEIAQIVGASPGAVKVRLHRATVKLREWFGADGGELQEERR